MRTRGVTEWHFQDTCEREYNQITQPQEVRVHHEREKVYEHVVVTSTELFVFDHLMEFWLFIYGFD